MTRVIHCEPAIDRLGFTGCCQCCYTHRGSTCVDLDCHCHIAPLCNCKSWRPTDTDLLAIAQSALGSIGRRLTNAPD
jgi:hypothetical protein